MAEKQSEAGASGTRWWHFALVLLLLGLAAAGLVWLVRASVRTFAALPPGTSAAIVTASATALVALGSILTTRFLERRSSREREQQQKRVPVYEDFVRGLLDVIGATRPPEDREEITVADVYKIVGPFTERLVIWGSDEVIREWNQYRYAIAAADSEAENVENLYRLESLLLAIRRDLGLPSKKLQRGDLLRLWINDIPA